MEKNREVIAGAFVLSDFSRPVIKNVTESVGMNLWLVLYALSIRIVHFCYDLPHLITKLFVIYFVGHERIFTPLRDLPT